CPPFAITHTGGNLRTADRQNHSAGLSPSKSGGSCFSDSADAAGAIVLLPWRSHDRRTECADPISYPRAGGCNLQPLHYFGWLAAFAVDRYYWFCCGSRCWAFLRLLRAPIGGRQANGGPAT